MTVPVVVVTARAFESDGTPIEGAIVKARMSGFDLYNDQIVDRVEETALTNASGVATLSLFPNTLGERNTAYVFTIRHPTTNRKIYQTVARVPNAASELTDIAGNLETTDSPTAPEVLDPGFVVRLLSGLYSSRSIQVSSEGLSITNETGEAGNPVIELADDMEAIEALIGAGFLERTGVDTWALLAISAYIKTVLVAADSGAARTLLGAQVAATILDAFIAVGNGMLARTNAGTMAARTITAPAAGIGVTNGDGVAGNPTLALANDLAALEGLGSTGIAVRSAADTWVQRTIVGTAGLGVADGSGAAANPTIGITDVELLAIAGLTSAADKLPYFTGSGAAALADFTSFGRTLAALASAAAGRTALAAAATTDLYGRIGGLTYANNAGDATNDIDIAIGAAIDATGAYVMKLAAAITKRLDAAWAVGTNQGGLDTGAIGNSDYYIWLIARSDTGVVDVLFSLSSTAPTMPASYDFKRLIGWFKRVGATIVAFTTYETEGGGIELLWTAPTLEVSLSNTLTTARRTDAVKVPLNFSTIAIINVAIVDAAGANAWIYCPDQADAAPGGTGAPLQNVHASTTDGGVGQMSVRTSSTGTIAARASVATIDTYAVSTLGFRWSRRN